MVALTGEEACEDAGLAMEEVAEEVAVEAAEEVAVEAAEVVAAEAAEKVAAEAAEELAEEAVGAGCGRGRADAAAPAEVPSADGMGPAG